MKRKLALVTAFLSLFIVLATGLTMNAQAATTPIHTSSPDFYTLEKTCAVMIVHLHGTHSPTTICVQEKATSGVSPKTEVAKNCGVPGVTLEIQYQNDNQQVCFIEKGYWGYRVNDVTDAWSPLNFSTGTGTNGWILWYYSGETSGYYCNLNDGNEWGADLAALHLTIDITQIDPGAQYSGNGSQLC